MRRFTRAQLQAVAAWACLVVILAMNALAVQARLPRPPTFDEAEHLHAAWLLSEDKRIYRDFVEDHSPFLPQLLQLAQPSAPSAEFPRLDVARFLTRARVLMAACGTLAALAAALFAWRVSEDLVAPIVVLASVLGSELAWLRGVADVRNDPPALALFWLGALLLVKRPATRGGAITVGLGLGCLGVAALWNPKWPLVSLVLALYAAHWLVKQRSVRQAGWTLGVAGGVVGITLALILRVATLGDFLFFVVNYNVAFAAWFGGSAHVGSWFAGTPATFYHCAAPFHPFWATLGFVLLVAACAAGRVRRGVAEWSGWLLVIVLAPTALAEMVLVFPWPRLWSQYYLMWSSTMAVVYGCAQAALGRVLSAVLPARAVTVARVCASGFAATLAMSLYLLAWRDLRHDPGPTHYFRDVAWVQRQLRPGDTVWLQPADGHPIGAADASYYWFGFTDLVPFSLEFARAHPGDDHLPKLRMDDLPPCRAAAGTDRSLRFIAEEANHVALPCMKRLAAAGRLRETPVHKVLEVLAP